MIFNSRVDLRPTASHDAEREGAEGTYIYDGPSLEVAYEEIPEEPTRRHRRSRILSTLNIGRMREATPEERIDALRRLRDEGLVGAESESSRPRRRFSRLSRAFGSRPTSAVMHSRPVSGVPEPAGEPREEEETATAAPAEAELQRRDPSSMHPLETIQSMPAHSSGPLEPAPAQASTTEASVLPQVPQAMSQAPANPTAAERGSVTHS